MRRKGTVFAYLVLCVGIVLLCYPTISSLINAHTQSRAIAGYSHAVETMSADNTRLLYEQAVAYNKTLVGDDGRFTPDEEERTAYYDLLDVTGTGIMSYIEISSIDVRLPIYHGTDDSVLQAGAGHMIGSSLPVGGSNTHCVVSGHSGLVSSRLLTDLEDMEEGDTFSVHTLGNVLTYQVNQIKIVLPDELDDLEIADGKDYFTLVTCTPYGVNSHRLLVRGERIDTPENASVEINEVGHDTVPSIMIVVIAGVGIVAITLIVAIIKRKPGKRGEKSG